MLRKKGQAVRRCRRAPRGKSRASVYLDKKGLGSGWRRRGDGVCFRLYVPVERLGV